MLNLKLQGRGKSQGTQRRKVWAIMVRTLHMYIHFGGLMRSLPGQLHAG